MEPRCGKIKGQTSINIKVTNIHTNSKLFKHIQTDEGLLRRNGDITKLQWASRRAAQALQKQNPKKGRPPSQSSYQSSYDVRENHEIEIERCTSLAGLDQAYGYRNVLIFLMS